MTDSYQGQEYYGINTQKKSKRRDLFQTAPISRNIFHTASGLNEYKDQQEQIPQKANPGQKSQSLPFAVPQNTQLKSLHDGNLSQTKIISIKSQEDTGVESTEVNKKQKHKQTKNDFIFQGSDSSEDQDKLQLTQLDKVQIIFEDNNHEEQEVKVPEPQKPGKKTISLFGQKIQVDSQLLDDKTPKIQPQNNKPPAHPKQLLRAATCMAENVFAKMKLQRIKTTGSTVFMLSLQANSRFILACKHTSSQTYVISENPDIFEQNGPDYVGKIKTTFFGNELSLYTKGLNPQKAKQKKILPRQLICTVITHTQQLMQEVKPRDFTVYLLKNGVSYYNDLIGTVMYEDQVPLNKLYNDYQSNKSKIWVYENRKSKWQEKQKMYSLNMKGRAKLPSIKNFVLESPAQEGRDVMLLGKMSQNQFSLDIHHPISPAIGIAIALTSFTHKSW